MITMTKIKLELIPDPNIYIFFGKGTRSGISYISSRYSQANYKYLKTSDPKWESKHITYLDTNNLFGFAISNFFSKKWIQMNRS